LRQLEQGGMLKFGPIQFNKKVIIAFGEQMPWAEVENVDLDKGFVVIDTLERLQWAKIDLFKIPHSIIFVALTNKILDAWEKKRGKSLRN
jgi:hypothetical protein